MTLLRRFMHLGSIANYPSNAGLSFSGNIPDLGSLIQIVGQLQRQGMSVGGNPNFATSAGTTITLTNLGNLTQRLTAGSAVTVTLDYAYNIVAAMGDAAFRGQTFGFEITTNASTTVATPTLSDGAVTLAGTTTVLAAAKRNYLGQITQLTTTTGFVPDAGTTFTSIAQVGTTNAYTVTLGVNATVPTVGTAIYLGVTAGTLPPGWYPIVKVTSATSFVIATPVTGTAWTATAVTFGTTSTAPVTFNPLVTITGMYATATAVMSV
jgi:hypothetical protein